MAVHKLSILVEAIGAAKAAKGLKGLDATISRIGARGGQGLRTTADNLGRIGLIGAGVAAAGLVAAVKAAADFESQLNTINTVADVTSSELAGIGKQIRDIAKSTGTPLEELTQGYYDLVSAGISAAQANKVLAASNTLSIGGLSTAAEGVDLITTALNSYGVAAKDQGSEAVRFADIFAKSIESGKVTAAELAATFAGVGPLAATLGVEIEEVAAGYAQLTAKGVPAAEAATQMEAAMVALMRKTAPLKKLEKQTGRNYEAIAGSKGLAVAFEMLRKDAEKAGVPIIELVGRKEALLYALNTTGDAMVGYNANLKDMQNAEGTAARQMASRQKGLSFQISRLKSLAIDAGITIGSKLLPKITPLAERAVAFLATHEADIERFGDNIAKGFDKALAFSERIPWATIGSGLQTAAEWSGKLMDTFLNLPPEVQSTIIALAGLNKLSGGAITGIAGELGKGLIKGVLGMNAGVVNLRAGVVNGGGVGGGAVGGSKGGKLGGVMSAVGKVMIVGMAAGVAAELWGIKEEQTGRNVAQAEDLGRQGKSFASSAKEGEIRTSLAGIESYTKGLLNSLTPEAIAYQLNIDGVRTAVEQQKATLKTALVTLGIQQRPVIRASLEGAAASRSTAAASRVMATEIRNGMKVTVPVTVKVGFSIRELQAGIRVQKSYAGGYGSR